MVKELFVTGRKCLNLENDADANREGEFVLPGCKQDEVGGDVQGG